MSTERRFECCSVTTNRNYYFRCESIIFVDDCAFVICHNHLALYVKRSQCLFYILLQTNVTVFFIGNIFPTMKIFTVVNSCSRVGLTESGASHFSARAQKQLRNRAKVIA